jgi:hypothetical protein
MNIQICCHRTSKTNEWRSVCTDYAQDDCQSWVPESPIGVVGETIRVSEPNSCRDSDLAWVSRRRNVDQHLNPADIPWLSRLVFLVRKSIRRKSKSFMPPLELLNTGKSMSQSDRLQFIVHRKTEATY